MDMLTDLVRKLNGTFKKLMVSTEIIMSTNITLEKNIKTIQDKLATFEPGSRNYIKYSERLQKKINQFMRFKETRAREESIKIKNLIETGVEIDLKGYKLSDIQK